MILRVFTFMLCSLASPGCKDSLPCQENAYLGTKTLYRPQQPMHTPPPPGYLPVFINYVGRHGARFLTGEGEDAAILTILSMAGKEDALTAMGHRLKDSMAVFMAMEKNNYGNITTKGEQEQAGIGERMRKEYPSVFRGNGLTIVTTEAVRTRQSEAAFLRGLGGYSGSIHLSTPPDSLNDALEFYHISPAYRRYGKSDAIRQKIDSVENGTRMQKVAMHIAGGIFRGEFLQRLQQGDIRVSLKKRIVSYNTEKFAEGLYAVYAISGAFGGGLNLCAFFSTEDLQWLDFENGAEDFLEKGPAMNAMGIQVRDAVPLLADFINSTEGYIRHPAGMDAKLRFTHAEAISPFAALSGIPAAGSACASIYDYQSCWDPAAIIPMSANIQWILYSDSRHDYLLKVLLNEKEVRLPVATGSYPYYEWNKAKAYFIQLLSSLHTGLNENMHGYLLDLN